MFQDNGALFTWGSLGVPVVLDAVTSVLIAAKNVVCLLPCHLHSSGFAVPVTAQPFFGEGICLAFRACASTVEASPTGVLLPHALILRESQKMGVPRGICAWEFLPPSYCDILSKRCGRC